MKARQFFLLPDNPLYVEIDDGLAAKDGFEEGELV